MQSVEALVELFRQHGFKITPQRRAIFELLSQDDSHPTAEEVYQHVSAVMPDISRTTVYNTLRELVELGEVAPVEDMSESGVHYDTYTGGHHHLFCMRCHALIDISRDFAGLELTPDESAGYQIVKQQVTFYGYCPHCRSNPKP
ncbi:MAG: transcriptional repressor [Thermoflexales bacterium]|nr:transcriptional repressor [Thermoflexales bacterium]